jgi:NosR/NirI family transcriptional regulator, nitrous oxide reductase regulator
MIIGNISRVTGIQLRLKESLFLILIVSVTVLLLVVSGQEVTAQQQRFPMPEFDTEYTIPDTTTPEPRSETMEYVDLSVLLAVLAFTTWLVLKKRSRNWIFWVAVFSLIYFGFYRNGCICSVGAVQNLALSLFTETYAISLTVLAFFIFPLLLTLFAGRIFCASACPLGVIQDLVIVKPMKLSPWLQKTLGLFPFIYLGFAILYAATGTDFIICRYDPFVGIFRLGAEFHMIILGISFLLIGMFVARPYCRFVCPYGALLNIGSRFSKYHLSITPSECINCKLCKDSCPFDAIDYPTEEKDIRVTKEDNRRFIWIAMLLPLLIFIGGLTISGSYKLLSRAHPDVHLASLLTANPQLMQETGNLDIDTFMASGKTIDMLVAEATVIQKKFKTGGWYLGGFIGLVIGLTLLNQMVFRKRSIYEANKGDCYSCGRCMDYCPVGKPDHPYHKGS